MQNCIVIVTGLSGLRGTANKIGEEKRDVNRTKFVPSPLLGTPSLVEEEEKERLLLKMAAGSSRTPLGLK